MTTITTLQLRQLERFIETMNNERSLVMSTNQAYYIIFSDYPTICHVRYLIEHHRSEMMFSRLLADELQDLLEDLRLESK